MKMTKFHNSLTLNMPNPIEVDLYYSEDSGKAGLWHSSKPLPSIGDRIEYKDYEAVVMSYIFEAGWIMLRVYVPDSHCYRIVFGVDMS